MEGRPKHYWSIYQKMIVKGRDFDDIHDLVGVRILCDEIRDCYAAVGVVHSLWQPMAGRFKDYIAQPRYGVYQSLHTTVVGPEGKPLEVQIRTSDMHRTAEYGIAAHWRYKEAKGRNGVPSGHAAAEIDDMAWMRQLLDWQREAADPGEFLESLRYDLAVQEIFVFTPKGDVITLPAGSTPVDFAYAVHTEVGHRCIGARVNGRLVALERKLENGEVVEVFTSKAPNAGPVAGLAEVRGLAAGEGQDPPVVRQGAPRGSARVRQGRHRQGGPPRRASVAALDECRVDGGARPRAALRRRLRALHRRRRAPCVGAARGAAAGGPARRRSTRSRTSWPSGPRRRPCRAPAQHRRRRCARSRVRRDVLAKLAKCCTPVPGDEIMGFVTRGGGVSVHRTDCTNADSLQEQSERIIDVEWAPSPSSVFLVAIQIEALDRHRLLSDVTKVLADEKVNILSASVTTSGDRVAISRFTFEMGDPKHLGHCSTWCATSRASTTCTG